MVVQYLSRCFAAALPLVLLGSLVGGCSMSPSPSGQTAGDESQETAELADLMGSLQRHTHKLTLSADARNGALADFYLHEIEEVTEEIVREVPEYEGHPVGQLTEQMLDPQIETLEESLEERNWQEIQRAVGQTIESCNQCHAATDHGFIQITSGTEKNPYNQRFEP